MAQEERARPQAPRRRDPRFDSRQLDIDGPGAGQGAPALLAAESSRESDAPAEWRSGRGCCGEPEGAGTLEGEIGVAWGIYAGERGGLCDGV